MRDHLGPAVKFSSQRALRQVLVSLTVVAQRKQVSDRCYLSVNLPFDQLHLRRESPALELSHLNHKNKSAARCRTNASKRLLRKSSRALARTHHIFSSICPPRLGNDAANRRCWHYADHPVMTEVLVLCDRVGSVGGLEAWRLIAIPTRG